jgi:hypothetical protein
MVEARHASYAIGWPSLPDSGFSVDNIPPAEPSPFTGDYSSGATYLHWGENSEPDLGGYRLYSGASAGFVPGAGNLIASQPDTGFTDVGPAGKYYKLAAVDIHGNQSAFALLTPTSTLSAGGSPAPRALALDRPRPNPAREMTNLSFALPQSGPVKLAIYDMAGRRVRTLASGWMEAGSHQQPFDLRDDAARRIPSGLYFVRLAVGRQTLVSRLAVVD